jgi:arylsulfatase A
MKSPSAFFSCTLFVVCGFLFTLPATGSLCAASRPNVILIMADDLGYETLGCYGSASYRTPRLDRLASEGLLFSHAYAQPLCTPSRLQIMTGKYNVRNYTQFGDMLPKEKTIGNHLRDRGYSTAIAGKWQLGGDRTTIAEFGFDRYCLWWLERRSQRYFDFGEFIQDGVARTSKPGEYGPDVMNDYVLDFITQHAGKAQPFFCYYPMLLTHAPMSPTPKSVRTASDAAAPKRKAARTKKSDGAADADDGERGGNPRYFPDMVAYMDELVGRVIDRLEKLGIRDNTLLIFTGDNGTNTKVVSRMKDGSLIEGAKGRTTEAGMHVPLLISWPAVVKPARIDDRLVDFTDFLPTFCQLAGLGPKEMPESDGISLLPLLQGEKAGARDWSYCWYSSDGAKAKAAKFARTIRYKLYADGRFFDLQRDSLEQHPLKDASVTAELGAVRTRLKTILDRYDAVEASR